MNGLPLVERRHEHEDRLELGLRVGADCPWFEGHFPAQPILPGVVQIGWAAWFVAEWSGRHMPPTLLTRIKFKRPIRPGARLTLRLVRHENRFDFEYMLHASEDCTSASSGSFSMTDGAANT